MSMRIRIGQLQKIIREEIGRIHEGPSSPEGRFTSGQAWFGPEQKSVFGWTSKQMMKADVGAAVRRYTSSAVQIGHEFYEELWSAAQRSKSRMNKVKFIGTVLGPMLEREGVPHEDALEVSSMLWES